MPRSFSISITRSASLGPLALLALPPGRPEPDGPAAASRAATCCSISSYADHNRPDGAGQARPDIKSRGCVFGPQHSVMRGDIG